MDTEVLVLASLIYYFTMNAQIQSPIQRMYCVNAPAKVKKMALLLSSHSPGVYSGAIAEYKDICNYWQAEDSGIVTDKLDEQKTEQTKAKIARAFHFPMQNRSKIRPRISSVVISPKMEPRERVALRKSWARRSPVRPESRPAETRPRSSRAECSAS